MGITLVQTFPVRVHACVCVCLCVCVCVGIGRKVIYKRNTISFMKNDCSEFLAFISSASLISLSPLGSFAGAGLSGFGSCIYRLIDRHTHKSLPHFNSTLSHLTASTNVRYFWYFPFCLNVLISLTSPVLGQGNVGGCIVIRKRNNIIMVVAASVWQSRKACCLLFLSLKARIYPKTDRLPF